MSLWFYIFAISFFLVTPFHFKSVEHTRLMRKHGRKKGIKIGKILGTASGTIESIILVGLWVSPQPTFIIPMISNLTISIVNLSIPFLHLLISLPLIMVGAWFGIEGVKATGLEVAETHCSPKKIITSGVYSNVRHPQYLGWFLAHIGISTLLSVWYSMLFTPVLLTLIYLISRKEEVELTTEFGKVYKKYQKEVSMLVPRWK